MTRSREKAVKGFEVARASYHSNTRQTMVWSCYPYAMFKKAHDWTWPCKQFVREETSLSSLIQEQRSLHVGDASALEWPRRCCRVFWTFTWAGMLGDRCKEPYSDALKDCTPGEIVMELQRPDAGLWYGGTLSASSPGRWENLSEWVGRRVVLPHFV